MGRRRCSFFLYAAGFINAACYRDESHNRDPPLAVVCFFTEASRPLIDLTLT